MKLSYAADLCLDYHRANSSDSTVSHYEFVLGRLLTAFPERDVETLSPDEVMSFMAEISKGNKPSTRRSRFQVLLAFYNFITSSFGLKILNPCDNPLLRKMYRHRDTSQWDIFDKEVIDEIIFRTTHKRNRLMLELMARGGMRIGEVLQLTPRDIDDRKLHIRTPKSRRSGECVFIPQRLSQRLRDYIVAENIGTDDRIFPLTYVGGRRVVMKAGEMAGIHLRPHDLRRFAATYASRAGTPIEVVSKIILRHANLATTQRYLGRIKDVEAIRWIENLYG